MKYLAILLLFVTGCQAPIQTREFQQISLVQNNQLEIAIIKNIILKAMIADMKAEMQESSGLEEKCDMDF